MLLYRGTNFGTWICQYRYRFRSETSWHRRPGTITLPNLDFLELKFTKGTDARLLLDLLSIPNLATLEVFSIDSRLNYDESTFTELASRSDGMKRLETLNTGSTLAGLDTMLMTV
ncbi:hypothetical protein AX17_002567 [Amanita inopinata Kibby_2008]|nr:hypothetical protein AX17_002567 [Amanita inopinata Kibby_2008]